MRFAPQYSTAFFSASPDPCRTQTETLPIDRDTAGVDVTQSHETADPFLPIDSELLTQASKPFIAVQELCNWIHRESRATAQEELAELRSEVPRRRVSELRRIVQEESDARSSATDVA